METVANRVLQLSVGVRLISCISKKSDANEHPTVENVANITILYFLAKIF